jgi:hypothetical protein
VSCARIHCDIIDFRICIATAAFYRNRKLSIDAYVFAFVRVREYLYYEPSLVINDVVRLLKEDGVHGATRWKVAQILKGLGYTRKRNGFAHYNKFTPENIDYYCT